METTFNVKGMTCDHCANAVTGEIMAIDGVSEVVVNVETGEVTVTSEAPLAQGDVAGAVEEAGYELVS